MTAVELLFAGVLDALLGDPRWLPHPVRLMGRVVTWCEQWIRRTATTPRGQKAWGIVLALGLPALAYLAARLLITWAERHDDSWRAVVVVVLAWTTLAARDLVNHAWPVFRALEVGDLASARKAVAAIVGRDSEHLSEHEVVRATVETLAESTSDGIVAPLFYLALGGPALALSYKAVSTLDSIVGHPEEPYRYLGWASARLDDVANWLPARLTGLLFVVAAGLCGLRPIHAWQVLRRDGAKHPSPNSGRPEAAMAGALGVQLGGVSTYGGVPSERPRLGEPTVPLAPRRIGEALRLVILTSIVAFAAALALSVR